MYPSNALNAYISIFRALSKSSSGDSGAGSSWANHHPTRVKTIHAPSPPPYRPDGIPSRPGPPASPKTAFWTSRRRSSRAASLAEAEFDKEIEELERENCQGEGIVDGWNDRLTELSVLMKQVREPGARGSYLKDSEKAEMHQKHNEDPETYAVERLAKDYRIVRQMVHAILWVKEIEEEEEKKLGRPLNDSIELILDTCPE